MKMIVDSRQMKSLDSRTICYYGVPSLVLMERAALRVAEHIPEEISHGGRILVVCGNGNNGADGFAVARLLHLQGCRVTALAAKGLRSTQENGIQRAILEKYGVDILEDPDGCSDCYDCVIDALLGIGISGQLREEAAKLVRAMNSLGGYKVAVDMPSGISSDTGQICGDAFSADLTVTFAFRKLGQVLYPGREYCGRLVAADIGITKDGALQGPLYYAMEQKDVFGLMARPARSHKGMFGKVLVIAGSAGMAGAAVFCAKAAYRMGCGLVKICTPEENRQILQAALPEAVLYVYNQSEGGIDAEGFAKELEWADSIAVGPGLGTGDAAQRLVQMALARAKAPLVVDADALNIVSGHLDWLAAAQAPVVVTPHMGEMARLTDMRIPDILNDPLTAAGQLAQRFGVTCVLKDAATVTALLPKASKISGAGTDAVWYINTSGCSAMAKGGSGDVLTGMLASLYAQDAHGMLRLSENACEQGLKAGEIAAKGVCLHGLAGEAAAAQKGECSVLAGDIIECIGMVVQNIGMRD